MKKNKIVIIGAGVIGLTCGVTLLEQGHAVSLYANEFSPNTASSGAGAIWMQFKAAPINEIKKWLKYTFDVCEELTKNKETGIELVTYREFYPAEVAKSYWLADIDYPYQSLSSDQIPEQYKSGFETLVYRLDSTLLLPYLQKRFLDLGGKMFQCYFSDLNQNELQVPIVINCMGAYAGEIVQDTQAFPIRGQYILIDKIKDLNIIQFCLLDEENYIAIVPRKNDCWLGGTTNPRTWDSNINNQTTEFILSEAAKIVPAVKHADILDVKVTFRSGRNVVRLEKEILTDGRILIHNYGHGGSGFSLSFGCAKEVSEIIEKL